MRHGFHEDRIRARRRTRIALAIGKWALVLAVFCAIGYYAYEAGTRLAQRDTTELRQQVTDLTTRLAGLQRDKDQVQRELAAATAQAEDLRKRYESDVPTGAISELLRVMRAKLAAGVKPERIAGVLNAAENTRSCDDKPTSKRFVVRIGSQRPPNDNASFADRLITVSAAGSAAIDAEGRPQAWFDVAKPLTVTFTRIGGESTAATGVLPLQHSVVLGDTEHRFVLTPADARGFLLVTSDSCKYP